MGTGLLTNELGFHIPVTFFSFCAIVPKRQVHDLGDSKLQIREGRRRMQDGRKGSGILQEYPSLRDSSVRY